MGRNDLSAHGSGSVIPPPARARSAASPLASPVFFAV